MNPEGRTVTISSVPGARLAAATSTTIQSELRRIENHIRTIQKSSQIFNQTFQPVSVEGGGTFRFNQLPSPDGQTSSQPALTIETFTNSNTGEIRVRVPLEKALPGIQEILAKNTGEVEIVPLQNIHHEEYFEVVSLSPTLSVAIAIAVAVLTKGMGSSLLGATGEAATFFADAGFTAISKNLAQGFAGEFVGDHQALERAFNADAVKQMAVSIVGQYMGQQVAGDLGIDPNAGLDNLPDLLKGIGIETLVQGPLRATILQEAPDKALTNAALNAAVSKVSRDMAAKIGSIRPDLDYLTHKLLHAIVGGASGALLNPHDPGASAASGAVGAVAAEVIAEALTPSLVERTEKIEAAMQERMSSAQSPLSEEEKNKLRAEVTETLNNDLIDNVQFKSRILAVLGVGFAGLKPETADVASATALENNWLQFVIMGGMAAWSVYDTYSVYKQEIAAGHTQEQAAFSAMKQLGFEIVIGAVGGKVIAKGATITAPSVQAAWSYVLSKNPVLKIFMNKMGVKVINLAETVSGKIARLDQAGDAFLTRHWTKATGRAATGEAAAAAEAASINQRPYHPRSMESHLESRYPGEVKSHTIAGKSAPNAKLANTVHPETGVPFDSRGFPIFDNHVIFETRITGDLALERSAAHMKKATALLKQSIQSGQIPQSNFTSTQLKDIFNVKQTIKDLVWHHHQELGRMQLIPREIHIKTGHQGGFSIWK